MVSVSIENGNCSLNGDCVAHLKWKAREVSVIRDFPPGCGPIDYLVTEGAESSQNGAIDDGTNNGGGAVNAEVQMNDDKLLSMIHEADNGGGTVIAVVQMNDDELLSTIHEADNGGGDVTEGKTKKLPERRVSAVRDFPPYCGLNAPEPSEEERLRINGIRKFEKIEDTNGVSDVSLIESVVSDSSNVSEEDGKTGKLKPRKKVHNIGQACEALVACTRDNIVEKTCSDDEDSKNEKFQDAKEKDIKNVVDQRVGYETSVKKSLLNDDDDDVSFSADGISYVLALEAASFCGPVTVEKDVGKKAKGSLDLTTPMKLRNKKKDDDADDFALDTDEQEHTRLVLGLKAPSLCASQIPASTKAKTSVKRKREIQEKVVQKNLKSKIDADTGTLEMVARKVDDDADADDLLLDTDEQENRRLVVGLKAPLLCAPQIPASSKAKTSSTKSKTFSTKAKTSSAKAKTSSTKAKTSVKRKQEVQEKVVGKNLKSKIDADTGTLEMVAKKVDDDADDFVLDTDEQEHRQLVVGLKAPLLRAPQIPVSSKAKTSVKGKREIQEKVVGKKLKSKIDAYTDTLEMVARDEEDLILGTEGQEEYINSDRDHDFGVMLPPLGPRSSNDARNKVREVLRLFQGLCRKIMQSEEAKNNDLTSAAPIRRVDFAAKAVIEKKGRALDLGKKTYGPVPGVEVGDEFQYRVELALVGIHGVFQAGIDYVKQGKHIVAVSVVASGGYDNEVDKPDCLIYSGAGGVAKDKTFFDQTLDRGNLALKNSIDLKIPVRVIRGYKTASSDLKSKIMTTYIYDGLYTVDRYWQERTPNGNLVYKFELKRIAGQPELALREVKSKKFKTRQGVVEIDIANGQEPFRISAINTIDGEKPPVFTYITKIMYPDWYRPVLTKGCDCVGRCSNKKCACGLKNGGEIPYNHNGAIVEAKPLVYECGPHCKCPPNCYNRVTQHGMKIQLEIFKTESRGWGVRSLSSISSGTFICEYIGELLEDTEAEKRTGNDEYLFDIGHNYSNCPVTNDTKSEEIVDSEGFTIDAANYGNVGRFINHSCSPNLYAQNVVYDQEDKRMPHIMLFAAENIPPLQELTYHYNYAVDTVHDSDGNIKVKNCYCGSSECTGRLY